MIVSKMRVGSSFFFLCQESYVFSYLEMEGGQKLSSFHTSSQKYVGNHSA